MKINEEPSWMIKKITYQDNKGRYKFKLHLGMFEMIPQGAEKLARYEACGTPSYFEELIKNTHET